MKQFELVDETIIMAVFAELAKAEAKHGDLPDDVIHQTAILAEECGETSQAAIKFIYEGGAQEEIVKEAIQVASTAIRMLKAYPNILSTLYEIEARSKQKKMQDAANVVKQNKEFFDIE